MNESFEYFFHCDINIYCYILSSVIRRKNNYSLTALFMYIFNVFFGQF